MLDGKLDERCWKRAVVIDRFASFWTDPPKPRPGTFAYLVWDDDALYYAGSMTDAELRSFGTKRNDHLWNGDVFELFLKPSDGTARVLRISGQSPRSDFRGALSRSAGTISAGSPMHRYWAARPSSP